MESEPSVGKVDFGALRRTKPVSGEFGADRGIPIDRWYIEAFLWEHKGDIRGQVLEFEDDIYTRHYGGGRVTKSDVMNLDPGAPKATIVGDITKAEFIPSQTYDCVICTQVLFLVYDFRAAVAAMHRILRPGGALLMTVSGLAQICPNEGAAWHDLWRFTSLSLRKLLCEFFEDDKVQTRSYGNVLAATALLHGLCQQDVTPRELDEYDENYQIIVSGRAVKT